MQSAVPGAMLAVQLAEPEARALASGEISLAAVNGAKQCVLSGLAGAIESLEKELAAEGVMAQRLQTSHAFHSASMEAILPEFTAVMRACKLQAPRTPYVSNVTGTWITAEEASDPAYWARHVRQPVRFADGLATLFKEQPAAMLEVGPGRVLAGLAARHPAKTDSTRIVSSLRSAQEATEDAQFLLAALAQLWVVGAQVEWTNFHSGEQRQRVELPTYPFERQRYWIDAPKAPGAVIEQPDAISYYQPVWKRAELPAAPGNRATWLIFLDAMGVGVKIAKDLERSGHTVVTLTTGDRFAKSGKNSYTVEPASRADYDLLLDALLGSGTVPERILHLWSLAAPAVAENPDTAQGPSFYSLLYLAQAIGARDITEPMSLAVVSNGLQSVAGEPVEHPARAVLLGPCKVIPKEFTSIRTRSIDVALVETGEPDRVARQILGEASQDFHETQLVAYRCEERWVESLEPARLERTGLRLRAHGVYLITGGTGGIGLEIAEHLARTMQAKLVLVSRTGQPRRADAIARLRALGAEVEIAPADVTDLAAMRGVVSRARDKFGRIDGVIHAAGVLDDGLIQLKQKDAAYRVLAPKVTGTLVLEEALAGVALDFLVLFSSVSCYTAPVGQVDYVAANAFLDAYAVSRKAPGRPWTVAINWGRWGETGMAAGPGVAADGHPLLGLRSTNTPDALVYHAKLSFEDHWLLNEHCLRGGDALFPGTGYIELAHAALVERLGTGAMEFERLSFSAPLRVGRARTRAIEIRVTREGEVYHYTVAAAATPATPYGSGSVRSLGAVAPRTIDLAALIERAAGRQLAFGPLEQNEKQARHIEFGPRWRCLRQMYIGANEAVSSLELAEQFAADLQTYRLHPALLDAATGSAMFTIPGYDQSDDLYVPVSYRSIRVFGDLPRRCWCHIRWPHSNHAEKEVVTFDITIADERGLVVAEIQEFTLRRLAGTAVLAEEPVARDQATIASAAGVSAFTAILDGAPVARVIAVPSSLRLDEPAPAAPPARSSPLPVSTNGVPRDEVEQTLAEWWQDLLGVDHVSIHQDFFELGGHSLIAVRLLTRIEKEFRQSVPLHAFFENATVAALAEYLRCAKPDRAPTVIPLNDKGSGPAIFCLHTMGGDLAAFRHLVRALGPEQNFFGIQAHPEQVPADFANSIERIAAYYVSEMVAFQPEGPYILAGASLGCTVALEMAQQLEAAGHKVDLLISIDGSPQNTGFETSRWNPRYYWKLLRNVPLWIADDLLDHFSWSEFGARVWRRGVATFKRAGSALLGRHRGPVYELEGFMNLATRSGKQAEFMRKLYTTFKNYLAKPYDGRVLLYQSRTEPLTHLFEVDRVWRGIALNVEVVRVSGNHTSLIQPPNVQLVAADLKRRLAALREAHKTEELTRQHV
jgi:acyl transferase domain-containing protein/thioesterase domain-containing protein